MRLLLILLVVFASFSAHAQRSFSNVFVVFSTVKTTAISQDFDGNGFSFGTQWEVGNQFYLLFSSSRLSYEREDDMFRYEIDSNQNVWGLGRYFNTSEKSKIDFSFATGRPTQDLTVVRIINGSSSTISEDLTQGQLISLSYIYQFTPEVSVSFGAVYQDVGVFEETGFLVDAIYSADNNLELGFAVSKIDESSQMIFTVGYALTRNK